MKHYCTYLTRVLWPRYSQRSGENDAVEGITRAIGRVGRGQGPPVSHLCFNQLRWQLIADRNEWPNRIQLVAFSLKLVSMISLDRNYWEVINLLLVLPVLHLNIHKIEEIFQRKRLRKIVRRFRGCWHAESQPKVKMLSRDVVAVMLSTQWRKRRNGGDNSSDRESGEGARTAS